MIIPPSRRLERRTEEDHDSAPSLPIRPHNQHDLKEMRRVDRRHQTMRQTKLATTLTALGSATVLILLPGCSNDAPADEAQIAPVDEAYDPPARDIQAEREAAEASIPVGAPFGDAVWRVEAEGSTRVNVRPDRLIVDSTTPASRTIRAFTADGKEKWDYSLSGDDVGSAEVWVLDETVAVLEEVTTEGSGLDKDQTNEQLTLLSQEDGTEITTEAAASVNEFGVVVFKDGESALTEEGETVAYKAPEYKYTDDKQTPVYGIPPVEFPIFQDLESDEYVEVEPLATGLKEDILIIYASAGGETTYYAVDTKAGRVAYELPCSSGLSSTLRSPNGEYGVNGSIWMSETEGKCFGGGDGEKKIEFTAVADDGTAYGETEDGELVVVTNGGEAEVFEALVPVGVMNGDIAIHVSGEDDEGVWGDPTITANPIK